MTWKGWGLINEKTVYLEVTSVSSSWSSDRRNIEVLHSENHSSCLNKMVKMQHKPCCWNVNDVSMHYPLLSFVIFQMLSEKMSLGGSGIRHSEGVPLQIALSRQKTWGNKCGGNRSVFFGKQYLFLYEYAVWSSSVDRLCKYIQFGLAL